MRRGGGFPAWYAGCLITLLTVIEVARAVAGLPTPPPETAPTEVVMAVPPKPRTHDAGAEGTTPAELYTWERCASFPAEYADTCFAALARQRAERDPDGGLEACDQVADEPLRLECMADVAEGHALVDVGRSRVICDTIDDVKWRDQCVFGIAMAFVATDPGFALRTCEDAGQWQPFCRHDVNGERAVVDPDGAVAYCSGLPGPKQEFCWHGVGKYIGRVDTDRALATCAQAGSTGTLHDQCVHGAGWALSERSGAAALERCASLAGSLHDSCTLGVAYQLKRYDPDEAAAACDRAHDPGRRGHCLAFVRRVGPGAVSLPSDR